MVDDSELGHLMRAHLFSQPEPPDASDTCQAFGQLSPAELTPSQRACVDSAGDARWGARGLEGVNGSEACGRRWYGTRDVRCLLRGKDVLFVGNSVVRRQVRTAGHVSRPPTRRRSAPRVADVHIARPSRGPPRPPPAAQLHLGLDPDLYRQGGAQAVVDLGPGERSNSNGARPPSMPRPSELRRTAASFAQDNSTFGYHSAQLFTVDLATGDHKFTLPHKELCGVSRAHAAFNLGRMRQWRNPGTGAGSERLGDRWQSTKWGGREWRPMISMRLDDLAVGGRTTSAEVCGVELRPRRMSSHFIEWLSS